MESENKVLRQQALSMAEKSKVLQELEAENKSLRQKVLTVAQNHKMLANRSKSLIQVTLKEGFIFTGLKNLEFYSRLFYFLYSLKLAEGGTHKSCYSKSKITESNLLMP